MRTWDAEDVVAKVSDLLALEPFDAELAGSLAEPGATSLRLTPLRHDTDGYFVASFVRR